MTNATGRHRTVKSLRVPILVSILVLGAGIIGYLSVSHAQSQPPCPGCTTPCCTACDCGSCTQQCGGATNQYCCTTIDGKSGTCAANTLGCCNGVAYDTSSNQCCYTSDRTSARVIPSTQLCCNGQGYDPTQYLCCNGTPYDFHYYGCCGNAGIYSLSNQCCAGGVIVSPCGYSAPGQPICPYCFDDGNRTWSCPNCMDTVAPACGPGPCQDAFGDPPTCYQCEVYTSDTDASNHLYRKNQCLLCGATSSTPPDSCPACHVYATSVWPLQCYMCPPNDTLGRYTECFFCPTGEQHQLNACGLCADPATGDFTQCYQCCDGKSYPNACYDAYDPSKDPTHNGRNNTCSPSKTCS
jgi:hypothetical protein